MKNLKTLCLVAVVFALAAGSADAKGKPTKSATTSGSTGVATNYGCKVFPAGSSFTTASGATRLPASTNVCYTCDAGTCKVQSPASLAGSTFSN